MHWLKIIPDKRNPRGALRHPRGLVLVGELFGNYIIRADQGNQFSITAGG